MANTRDPVEALRRQRTIEALDIFVVASAAYIAAEDPQVPPSDAVVAALVRVGYRAIRRHLKTVDPGRRRPIDSIFVHEILVCVTRAMTEAWSTTGASFPVSQPEPQDPTGPTASQ